MKKAYLITYDLECDEKCELLEEELQKYKKWWHYLERTWIIISKETADEIWYKIEDKIDKKNNLLIIEVKKHSQGWLSQPAWDWIKENIEN